MSSSSKHSIVWGGVGQHLLLDYLKRMQAENPSFFYAIEEGDNDYNNNDRQQQPTPGNIFWADAASRMNYSCFGDTVRLDTTYRMNGYRVPFVAFTGLNHHGQPVFFGSALLLNDEPVSSFVWLIQTWLHAMSSGTGRTIPTSITTEPDGRLQMAVSQVLPGTRHRFCKWSIFRETKEKLAAHHVYHANPALEIEFNKCVNETESIDEFETCWGSLLERYDLLDNEWLQSMYNARQQWVPVFLRDTFFGEFSSSRPIDSGDTDIINSFFHGYVNSEMTVQLFIKQYEKALASWQEKELEADYETTNTAPVLKTPSPMEKQAANLYTRRIFMKFQEELVETLANPATKIEASGTVTTYRVAKFGDEHKAQTVRFNALEMKANCTCQMFEFSGIVCRHVLSVFRAKNVLTLPPEYILKRWTRNAKSGVGVLINEQQATPEFPSNLQDESTSLAARHNNLRQEVLKFVEEGAKAIHVYNVAMEALQQASKKVATTKKQLSGGGPTQANNPANLPAEMLQRHVGDENQNVPFRSVVEKEKRIHELTTKLECTNKRCEIYRANLVAVLRDMEDQKLKLAVKVQNARLSLKE